MAADQSAQNTDAAAAISLNNISTLNGTNVTLLAPTVEETPEAVVIMPLTSQG